MKGKLEPCWSCHSPYYHQLTGKCPRCGQPSEPPPAQPTAQPPPAPAAAVPAGTAAAPPSHKPGWGGKRKHAGAPAGNLNRITHGRQSKVLRRAIEKMAEDPELRYFFYLVARALTGEADAGLPETTRNLIIRLMEPKEAKARRAGRRLSHAKTLGD